MKNVSRISSTISGQNHSEFQNALLLCKIELNNWLPTLQSVCRPDDEETFVDNRDGGGRFREYFVLRYVPKRAFWKGRGRKRCVGGGELSAKRKLWK